MTFTQTSSKNTRKYSKHQKQNHVPATIPPRPPRMWPRQVGMRKRNSYCVISAESQAWVAQAGSIGNAPRLDQITRECNQTWSYSSRIKHFQRLWVSDEVLKQKCVAKDGQNRWLAQQYSLKIEVRHFYLKVFFSH